MVSLRNAPVKIAFVNLQHADFSTGKKRNSLDLFAGKVCLTFFGQWSEVQSEICTKSMEQMYCAPGKSIYQEAEKKQVIMSWCNLPPSCETQLVLCSLNKSPAHSTAWENGEMLSRMFSLDVGRGWRGVQGNGGV